MCFSESASFTVSALLIPTGIYCIKTVLNKNTAYFPLACMPLAFGIQQGAEGIVWWGINENLSPAIHIGASIFLFFSHWFWLFWIPWLAFNLECNQTTQRISCFFAIAGFLYGALLYLPPFIVNTGISATVIHRSIEYQVKFIGDFIPILFSRLLYALIILIPLLVSSNPSIKFFGKLVTIAASITYLMFNYAFVSVWCFFAALLSLYIVYVIWKIHTLPSEPLWKETIS